MSNVQIEAQLMAINQKLDTLSSQMQSFQKREHEWQELKHDLTIIGKDMFNAAVEELDDVAPYFDTKDLVYLIKKLLRNTNNITRLVSQLESAEDLFRDLQPLTKHIFDEILNTLNEMDSKGYFEFIRESANILDTIVTSFSVEDVRLLKENITSILLTVKSMTQPEILTTINNALGFFRTMDIDIEHEVSFRSLLKQLRDPEVRRGMVFMLEFVKNMALQKNSIQMQTSK